MSDTKKGSIELARWLCEDIAGELEGEAYGSVDVAEILSAEVERLRERMTELEHQNAALKKEAVIAEKYGLSQAAEICRDAALVHPINGYERVYNAACRDNYNAILKVKDKP